MIHKNNKNEYKIDDYNKWEQSFWDVYCGTNSDPIEVYKLLFYNKEHFRRYYPGVTKELLNIKTYGEALLHRKSEHNGIRTLCNYIIKGEIVI